MAGQPSPAGEKQTTAAAGQTAPGRRHQTPPPESSSPRSQPIPTSPPSAGHAARRDVSFSNRARPPDPRPCRAETVRGPAASPRPHTPNHGRGIASVVQKLELLTSSFIQINLRNPSRKTGVRRKRSPKTPDRTGVKINVNCEGIGGASQGGSTDRTGREAGSRGGAIGSERGSSQGVREYRQPRLYHNPAPSFIN